MNKDVFNSFESHFGIVSDPRIDRSKLYPLTEILFVVLSGSICGAESWRDYVLFGKEKLDFMRQYYPFEIRLMRWEHKKRSLNKSMIKKVIMCCHLRETK